MASYSFGDIYAAPTGPSGTISLGNGAGVADGGITVDRAEDVNTMTTGADGTVMHSLHMAKAGRVTVRLMKTSPTNHDLMTMYNFSITSAANHGGNTLVIRNVVSGDVVTCRDVAFTRAPTLTWSKDPDAIEWVFSAGYIDEVLGTGTPVAAI